MSSKRIAERLLWAEGQSLRDRPSEIKRKWLKTICPKCGAKVEYSPKPDFNGQLYCGSCGKKFILTMLDHFSVAYEEAK